MAVGLSACSSSSGTGVVRFEALIDGRPIVESSRAAPIPLRSDEELEVTLLITNVTSIPIEIGSVGLDGQVLGLTFVSARTGIDVTVFPGEERLIRFPVELYGLDGQANGLLRGRLALYGPDDRLLAAQPMTLDSRASVVSAASFLALVLLAVGAGSLAITMIRLLAGVEPDERRLRGLQFVPTGIAFGLALSVLSSLVRFWPMPGVVWLACTGAVGLAMYAIGVYLPPLKRVQRFETIDLTNPSEEMLSIASGPPPEQHGPS